MSGEGSESRSWYTFPTFNFSIQTLAIVVMCASVAPYYLQTPSVENVPVLAFVERMAWYVVGIWPWLFGHPVHLLAATPGLLVMFFWLAHPPRAW